MKPGKSALAIEAAQRLADYCIENGAEQEGVHDDLKIIEDPIRRYQKFENGHCDSKTIENEGEEIHYFPIRCQQIWVSSHGWFSKDVFTPPEDQASAWTLYNIAGDAV